MGTLLLTSKSEVMNIIFFRELLARYPFLDGNNVGVYGRGGAGAGAALEGAALQPPVYKCVALVSPVTDWHAHSTFTGRRVTVIHVSHIEEEL